MYKPGRARSKRTGQGGMSVPFINDYGLEEACPVQPICGKGQPRGYEAKCKLLRAAAIKHLGLRLNQQADQDACILTWPFELIDKATGEKLKDSEMDERTAAIKNRSIFDLGVYWRRASY